MKSDLFFSFSGLAKADAEQSYIELVERLKSQYNQTKCKSVTTRLPSVSVLQFLFSVMVLQWQKLICNLEIDSLVHYLNQLIHVHDCIHALIDPGFKLHKDKLNGFSTITYCSEIQFSFLSQSLSSITISSITKFTRVAPLLQYLQFYSLSTSIQFFMSIVDCFFRLPRSPESMTWWCAQKSIAVQLL